MAGGGGRLSGSGVGADGGVEGAAGAASLEGVGGRTGDGAGAGAGAGAIRLASIAAICCCNDIRPGVGGAEVEPSPPEVVGVPAFLSFAPA